MKLGIRSKILILTVLPTLIVAAILGGYFVNSKIDAAINSLEYEGSNAIYRVTPSIQFAISHNNRALLKHILSGITSDYSIISSASIYSPTGKLRQESGVGKPFSQQEIEQYLKHDTYQVHLEKHASQLKLLVPITRLNEISAISNSDLNRIRHIPVHNLLGWFSIGIDKATNQALQFKAILTIVIITLLSLLVALLFGLKIGNDMVDPILSIVRAADEIKKGKYKTRLNLKAKSELRTLEDAINAMAHSLENAHKHMQENVERATSDLRVALNKMETQNIQLTDARQKANTATKAKSEFLANMSHEIRTPLNAIIGFAELLLDTKLTRTQKDNLSTVHKSARNLLQIINDILDFSKIEAGKLALHPEPMNIRHAIKDVADLLSAKAKEKKLKLNFEYDKNTPEWIIADELRLKQILTNLVGNAIKFTHDGSVSISMHLDKSAKQQHRLQINVIDTGIGMDKPTQNKLFKAFTQADTSTTRKYGGTGLGLIISKKLVTQMKGEIQLSSKPEVGSTFAFTFECEFMTPAAAAKAAAKNAKAAKPKSKKHAAKSAYAPYSVLAVDDNDANLKLAKVMLSNIGTKVVCVDSGYEAVNQTKLQQFDLILMDLQMPGMDGIEACKKIRKLKGYSKTPIIALSADITATQQHKALKAGMSDFQTKPISEEKLRGLIDGFLGIASPSKPSPTQKTAVKKKTKTDSLIDLELGKQLVGGDEALAKEMLDLQLSRLPEELHTIETALKENNMDDLLYCVHKLHGGLCYVGLPKLKDAAADLEQCIKGKDPKAVQAKANVLIELIKAVIAR